MGRILRTGRRCYSLMFVVMVYFRFLEIKIQVSEAAAQVIVFRCGIRR
jgi:hypothetical protein